MRKAILMHMATPARAEPMAIEAIARGDKLLCDSSCTTTEISIEADRDGEDGAGGAGVGEGNGDNGANGGPKGGGNVGGGGDGRGGLGGSVGGGVGG